MFILNWRIIDLQYCVGFCHISTWIRHRTFINPPPQTSLWCLIPWGSKELDTTEQLTHTHIHTPHTTHTHTQHTHPHTHLPPHPTRWGCHRAPGLSSLHHAANSLWLFILHMVMCMFQCYSINSSHPLLSLQVFQFLSIKPFWTVLACIFFHFSLDLFWLHWLFIAVHGLSLAERQGLLWWHSGYSAVYRLY